MRLKIFTIEKCTTLSNIIGEKRNVQYSITLKSDPIRHNPCKLNSTALAVDNQKSNKFIVCY